MRNMGPAKEGEVENRGIGATKATGGSGGLKFLSRDLLASGHDVSSVGCHPPPIFSRSWDSIDFLKNYFFGRNVTLEEIGLFEAVKAAARKDALMRFAAQIREKALTQTAGGSFSQTFINSYKFRPIAIAMGGGILTGDFHGKIKIEGDSFKYEGEATISYYDEFTDPLDIIEKIYGSSQSPDAPDWVKALANGGGKPYKITGEWVETFSGSGVK